jgi:predicted nucleotidyltransferase
MPRKSSSSVRVFYPKRDREAVIRALRAGVDRLAATLPLRRVVLFGSYAKGTYTVASDVDLLVVYRGDPRPNAVALTKHALDVPRLEAHLYTEPEYEASRATLDRMTRDGVVLFDD